jgi:hypothetical protein
VRRAALRGALSVLLGICACGGSALPAASTAPVAEMKILAPSAVPELPFTTSVLTVTTLSRDASIPSIPAKLRSWGYIDGRERVFQGESRRLMLVISRSLIFKDATGARDLVAFVQTNGAAYFGATTTMRPLLAQGRSGWLFTPPPCACHLANPAFIGVLSDGPSVAWLEINGPAATPTLLVTLLDPALSTTTTLPG